MKKLLKSLKIFFLALFAFNAIVIIASVVLIILTYSGIITTGLWFPIFLGTVGSVDVLAALSALGVAELKRSF